jgi:hypothetical protein
MATAQEKMEAITYWAAASILTITMALAGTPIWSTINTINNNLKMVGNGASMHAVQGVPGEYYGFLICFEIAVILRTVFVVWSRTTYETGF